MKDGTCEGKRNHTHKKTTREKKSEKEGGRKRKEGGGREVILKEEREREILLCLSKLAPIDEKGYRSNKNLRLQCL